MYFQHMHSGSFLFWPLSARICEIFRVFAEDVLLEMLLSVGAVRTPGAGVGLLARVDAAVPSQLTLVGERSGTEIAREQHLR